jgi:hypothetical protein
MPPPSQPTHPHLSPRRGNLRRSADIFSPPVVPRYIPPTPPDEVTSSYVHACTGPLSERCPNLESFQDCYVQCDSEGSPSSEDEVWCSISTCSSDGHTTSCGSSSSTDDSSGDDNNSTERKSSDLPVEGKLCVASYNVDGLSPTQWDILVEFLLSINATACAIQDHKLSSLALSNLVEYSQSE